MRSRTNDLADQVLAALTSHRDIDLDTNFFEAGFTSATLADVVVDLNSRGLGVALLDLYGHPTVRALAAELRRRSGTAAPVVTDAGLPWSRRSPSGG